MSRSARTSLPRRPRSALAGTLAALAALGTGGALLLPAAAGTAVAATVVVDTAVASRQAARTIVILVRHAEKAAEPGPDPSLSAEGQARARALAESLRGSGVQAVVTSQFQRTKATAAPLAEALGLTAEVVPASADVAMHARQVAEAVLSKHAGRTVLVVGHSNTIPAIVRALGGEAAADIPDPVYDRMYVVFRDPGSEKGRSMQVRFGAASPAP
jgi:phosphohistidine phosphatase SixA